jgi:hypothetical protein
MFVGDVARWLPDATVWYTHRVYTDLGLPLSETNTYSGGNGTRQWSREYVYTNGTEQCFGNTTNNLSTLEWTVPMLIRVTGPDGASLLTLSGLSDVSIFKTTNSFTSGGTNYSVIRSFPQRSKLAVANAVNNTNTFFFNTRHQLKGINWANGLKTTNIFSSSDSFLIRSTNVASSGSTLATNYSSSPTACWPGTPTNWVWQRVTGTISSGWCELIPGELRRQYQYAWTWFRSAISWAIPGARATTSSEGFMPSRINATRPPP